MSDITLNDTAVLVTGAARGLGRAMTQALLRAGARVVAIDLDPHDPELASLSSAAAGQKIADRLLTVGGDIREPSSCEAIVTAAVERFGAVDGLVNNAGIGMQGFGAVFAGERPKFYSLDSKAWRNAFDTNMNGAFHMASAAARVFVQQRRGKIVNITTSFRTMQNVGFSPYGPTKAALEAASVVWAKDLEGSGVTVNVLLPGGAANTRMVPQQEVPDRSKLVQPDTMGPPVVWLMSSHSDGVTGRRFIANEWDDTMPAAQVAQRAGAPAGW